MSGLGEMGNLLRQAQEMQRQIDRMRSELRGRTVTGIAGGGVVRVELTADRHEVKKVEISPEALRSGDPTLVADLVASAFQDGLKRASDIERESFGRITGGLQLPGLF